mgnify:CR=1 FL=1|tara:strand:+ start:308 stop:949 length:642 start_codon:yes stop_codon:yes gene_type:complete
MEYFNYHTWNDKWVVDVFNKKRDGFFVEAGALNGILGSCTYVLESKLGWKGILVEPDPIIFQKLIENRPNSQCFDCCLYDENKELDYVQFELGGWSGISENWGPTRKVLPETHKHNVLKKKAITLEKLLKDNKAPKNIDYLALDVERSEEKILKDFPFHEFTFKAISIEAPTQALRTLLREKGYIEVGNPFCTVFHESYFIYKDYIEIKYKDL